MKCWLEMLFPPDNNFIEKKSWEGHKNKSLLLKNKKRTLATCCRIVTIVGFHHAAWKCVQQETLAV
jgi:hypothetical protein